MVRIEQGKLIIEVNCENQNPLMTLSEYQLGMLSAIHACSQADLSGLHTDPSSSFSIQMLLYRLTNLYKEMMLTPDQSEIAGNALLSAQNRLEQFNDYGAMEA